MITTTETYERLALRCSHAIDLTVLDLMEPQFRVRWLDQITRSMVVEMNASVWSQRLGIKNVEAGYRTWFDHFRAVCFPGWLNRRWEPRKQWVRVSATALYPELSNRIQPGPTLQITSIEQIDFTQEKPYAEI